MRSFHFTRRFYSFLLVKFFLAVYYVELASPGCAQ